jgi:hypothetical protein
MIPENRHLVAALVASFFYGLAFGVILGSML